MIWILIGLFLLIIFAAVIYYFFSVAFVRLNVGNPDDLNDSINKPLEKYKDIIGQGLKYINDTPHKWVSTVSFDGLRLAARYFDNSSNKTVILFHGYRSSAARDFSCAVEMYTKFGFNVLLCDQRSHGRSEGKLITFGVKESRDVLTWIDFVKENFEPEKILLGGMSMGATTVLLSVRHNLPDSVKGIVADCGFTSPVAIITRVAKKSMKINAKPFLPFLNLYCKIFGKFSIYGSNTAEVLKESDIPVIFVHGKADGFVPCEMSEEAYLSNKKNRYLVLVDNADHGLSYLIDKNLVESEINKFLIKYF